MKNAMVLAMAIIIYAAAGKHDATFSNTINTHLSRTVSDPFTQLQLDIVENVLRTFGIVGLDTFQKTANDASTLAAIYQQGE